MAHAALALRQWCMRLKSGLLALVCLLLPLTPLMMASPADQETVQVRLFGGIPVSHLLIKGEGQWRLNGQTVPGPYVLAVDQGRLSLLDLHRGHRRFLRHLTLRTSTGLLNLQIRSGSSRWTTGQV